MNNSGPRRFGVLCKLGLAVLTQLVIFPNHAAVCQTSNVGTSPKVVIPARPFSLSPEDLIRFADASPLDLAEQSAEIVLDDCRYEIDGSNRVRGKCWRIIRCLTRDAFDRRGVVEAHWSPWYQDRPILRARVVTRDGRIHELDQRTIEETHVRSPYTNIFTDEKMLRAPLPALDVDCIVETLVLTRDKRPFSKSGAMKSNWFGDLASPTRLARFGVKAPTSVPLHCRVLGIEARPKRVVSANRHSISVTTGPLPPLMDEIEFNLPSSMSSIPLAVVSTAKTWHDVAVEYDQIVEAQLADADLKDVVEQIPSIRDLAPRQVAEKVVELIQERTRYTGVSFGSAAIVPRQPREVLTRGYGDCKDLSTLCVGLLRAAGVQSQVALLRAGSGIDTSKGVPALASFNHAIVYVPTSPPMWIDPTERFIKPGQLPTMDQHRVALLIDAGTTDTVRTPHDTSEDSQVDEHVTITMDNSGGNCLEWKIDFHGSSATSARGTVAAATRQQLEKSLREHGAQQFGTDELVDFSNSAVLDLDQPFRLTAQFRNAPLSAVSHPQAVATLAPHTLFEHIPDELCGPAEISTVAGPEMKKILERRQPLSVEAVQYRLTYRIVPPKGFTISSLPDNVRIDVADATLRMDARREGDSAVLALLLDTGSGQFSVAEAKQMREKIDALGQGRGYSHWQVLVGFEDNASMLVQQGKVVEAVALLRQLVESEPDEPYRHAQLAESLVELGLQDLARHHALRAVKLAPNQSYAHQSLARVLVHDRLGEVFGVGFDRQSAVKAFQKAMQLSPDDPVLQLEYATLLQFDEDGVQFGNPQYTTAAAAEYRRIFETYKDDVVVLQLSATMSHAGKIRELEQLLRREQPGDMRDACLLLAVAASDGADRALQESAALRRGTNDRQQILGAVVSLLNSVRQYDVAAELAQKLAEQLPRNSREQAVMLTQAANARMLSRFDLPLEDFAESPTDLVRNAFAAALMFGPADAQLGRYFTGIPADHKLVRREYEFPGWLITVRQVLDNNQELSALCKADHVNEFDFRVVKTSGQFCRVRVKHKQASQLSWDTIVERTSTGYRLLYGGHEQQEIGRRCLELSSRRKPRRSPTAT